MRPNRPMALADAALQLCVGALCDSVLWDGTQCMGTLLFTGMLLLFEGTLCNRVMKQRSWALGMRRTGKRRFVGKRYEAVCSPGELIER